MMYNEADLLRDYSIANGSPSNDVKKELSTRYGIDSKKSAEIAEGILELIAEIRATKTEFTDVDYKNWVRMKKASSLSRIAGLKKAFEGETPAFQEFVRARFAEKYAKLIDKGVWRLTMGEKSWLQTLKTVERYFNEVVNEKEDKFLENLILRMEEQLKEYHDEYIRQNREFFACKYDNLKKVITDYKKAEKALIEKLGNYSYWNKPEYREFYNKYNKAFSKALGTLGNETRDEYIEREIVWVERTWKNDIRAIGERVRAKNMDEKNIQIFNPSSDPKFIEIHITDGIRNLWARSIIAAMCSVKVRPHYRFIITEQN